MGEAEDAGNRGVRPCPSPKPWRRTGERHVGLGEGQQSLVSFSKDIVLFALHVLKVKGRACHTLVDVFDVIAGCLKVCGGIIGAGTEHLKTARAGAQDELGRGRGQAARGWGQDRLLTWLSEPSSMGSYKSLMATNLKGRWRGGDRPHNQPCPPWYPSPSPPAPQLLGSLPPPSPSLLVNGLQ